MRSIGGPARTAVLIYGLLSAAFYCGLLPLWEGFDELYHYGYVQYVSTNWKFPVAGQTTLSRELWTSLDDAPISHYLQPHVYRPSTNFQQYFSLPAAERVERRRALDAIPRALQREPSPRENYEAKHAPLTYLFLAPLDRVLSGASLTTRILTLRLVLAMAAIALLWMGARRLAQRLRLPAEMESAALFLIFSCQMVYAVACHIGNDALLLPWLVFFLTAVIDSCESPTLMRMAVAAAIMAVGLLIKASALFFFPVLFAAPLLLLRRDGVLAARLAAVGVAILAVLAGPWYARNLILYGTVSATNDSTAGIGAKQLLDAARKLPWAQSLAGMAHGALWTGNNSRTTFSALTLDVILSLLALAGVLYVVRLRRSAAELIVVTAIALYSPALIVISIAFFSSSNGAVTAAEPWYIPPLLALVVLLCFLGLTRWRRTGRWIAIASVLLLGYVAGATWIAKLVPMYGGFPETHAHARQLWTWYLSQTTLRDSILSDLSPAPLPCLYVLFFAVLAALVTACVLVLAPLIRARSLALDKIP